MTRGRRTAFSALAHLDPLRSVRGEPGGRRRDPTTADIEMQIARILAVPRGDEADHRGVGSLARPTVKASRRPRPRYGALGLVTSAALAVIATLLWVSPSAGEPIGQASVVPAGVIHHEVTPGAAATTSLIR
jgi:hypothetical protein